MITNGVSDRIFFTGIKYDYHRFPVGISGVHISLFLTVFLHRFGSLFLIEQFRIPSVQRPVSKCLCRGFTVYLFHACVFQSFVPLVSRHCCESKFLSPVLNSGRTVNRFPIHQGSHFVVFLHDLNIIQIVMHAD